MVLVRDDGIEWVLDISGKVTEKPGPHQPVFIYAAERTEDGIVHIRYLNYVPELAEPPE